MRFLKYTIFFFTFCLSIHTALAQQYVSEDKDSVLDSMKALDFDSDTVQLKNLLRIATEENNPDSIAKYANMVLELSLEVNQLEFTSDAYLQLGNALNYQGNLASALEMYLKSIAYADSSSYDAARGRSYTAMAGTYSQSGDSENAIIYYSRAIPILQEYDSASLALAYFNIGDEYLNLKNLDSARYYNQRAFDQFERQEFEMGIAYCLGNFGLIQAETGQIVQAETSINEAVNILEGYEDYYGISAYLELLSNIFLKQGKYNRALTYAKISLDIAQEHGLKDQISVANLTLSKIYEAQSNTASALSAYKDYIAYRDSVNNIATVQEMANLRTDFEVAQKQVEVDLLESKATVASLQSKRQQLLLYGAVLLLILLGVLAIVIFRRFRFEKETKDIIQTEKDRSEELLLNILPEEIAEELKVEGKVKAHRFNEATVLFTDFKSFSTLAEQISPEQLVESIDFYFKEFDAITDKYDLEKIKTIGDSYMCAGGIPIEAPNYAFDVVRAAKEMMDFTMSPKPKGILQFDMRIGIHTGPVVAGIVGVKKWQYDIWGDTVNIASRMETNSEEGRINISETTYEIIKDKFEFEYRGSIDIKNRGVWGMYYLVG